MAHTSIKRRPLRLNPAKALVEILVQVEMEAGDLPDALQYLEIEAPDTISIETVNLSGLGRRWQKNQVATRRAGDQWLQVGKHRPSACPSVIAPATWSVLVNPSPPGERAIRIVRVHSHGIDPRLL